MHVAALSGQSGIMRSLIKTIKNIQFIRRLYVNDTEEQSRQRIQFILDMYLNTPDKMVGCKNSSQVLLDSPHSFFVDVAK